MAIFFLGFSQRDFVRYHSPPDFCCSTSVHSFRRSVRVLSDQDAKEAMKPPTTWAAYRVALRVYRLGVPAQVSTMLFCFLMSVRSLVNTCIYVSANHVAFKKVDVYFLYKLIFVDIAICLLFPVYFFLSVHEQVRACECGYPRSPEEDTWTPGAGVTERCQLTQVNARNAQFSARAASTLNSHAISPAHLPHFPHIYQYCNPRLFRSLWTPLPGSYGHGRYTIHFSLPAPLCSHDITHLFPHFICKVPFIPSLVWVSPLL